MSFRTTALVAKGLLYGGGTASLLVLSVFYPYTITLALLWLVQKPRFVHRHIMPKLFTHVRCTNGACACLIPLVQRYKLREYNHNRPEHVFRVRDPDGREVLSIDCPKATCKTTIPIQKGTDSRLVRATVIGNAFALSRDEKRPSGFVRLRRRLKYGARQESGMSYPIGINRHDRPTLLQRLWRLARKKDRRLKVIIPEDVYGRHGVWWGKSGMGKSTLIQGKMQWIMDNDMGATVIDPSGQLVNDILKLVPESRKDDVILIRAKDRNCPFQLNVLDAKDEMAELNLKNELLQTIKAVSDSWGADIAMNIERAIETAKLVGGSLQEVFDLLTKQSARDRILTQIDDEELLDFWTGWESTREKSKTPTVRKIRGMIKHPILGPMLGAKESNFDAEEAIRDSKIVLVDLDSSSDTDEVKIMLGNILTAKIRGAAGRQEKGKEVRHFLIIDEASDFVHPGMKLGRMLSQARKQKLSLLMAAQHPSQMKSVIEDIFGNAGTILSFSVDLADADTFAKRMQDVTAEDIMDQNKYECTARIGRTTHFIRTELPERPAVDQTNYIEEKMRAMCKATRRDEETGEGFTVRLKTQSFNKEDIVCQGVR